MVGNHGERICSLNADLPRSLATALGIVYFKIKRSGMTAPKKRIFILHIVLVLLVLAFNLSANLVMKKSEYWKSKNNNFRKWNCWAADLVII